MSPASLSGRAELRQQPGEVTGDAGQQPGHAVGAQVADQLAQHRGERRERQAVGAEFHAAAGQHPGPGRPRARRELAHQPGLAHARLAADQDHRRAVPAGRGEGSVQDRQLARAPDQDGAGAARGHVPRMPGRGAPPAANRRPGPRPGPARRRAAHLMRPGCPPADGQPRRRPARRPGPPTTGASGRNPGRSRGQPAADAGLAPGPACLLDQPVPGRLLMPFPDPGLAQSLEHVRVHPVLLVVRAFLTRHCRGSP